VDRTERHAIEHECTKLINRFYYLFNQDMSLVADMFTDDGVLMLGRWQVGPGPESMKEPLHRGSKNMLEGVEVVLNTVSITTATCRVRQRPLTLQSASIHGMTSFVASRESGSFPSAR
jgi:hypothetical protein